MTRRLTASLALALIGVLLVFDLSTSAAPNPFKAPPAVALRSGQAAAGAHCSALPDK